MMDAMTAADVHDWLAYFAITTEIDRAVAGGVDRELAYQAAWKVPD